jgi:hypothetical protein
LEDGQFQHSRREERTADNVGSQRQRRQTFQPSVGCRHVQYGSREERQPITSDLKDNAGKSTNDALDADLSTPDGINDKKEVVMEKQLSKGAVALGKDADASDEPRISM